MFIHLTGGRTVESGSWTLPASCHVVVPPEGFKPRMPINSIRQRTKKQADEREEMRRDNENEKTDKPGILFPSSLLTVSRSIFKLCAVAACKVGRGIVPTGGPHTVLTPAKMKRQFSQPKHHFSPASSFFSFFTLSTH